MMDYVQMAPTAPFSLTTHYPSRNINSGNIASPARQTPASLLAFSFSGASPSDYFIVVSGDAPG